MKKTKETCRNCRYISYIKTPEITGNPIDYVCRLNGSVIRDIDIRHCDEHFEKRQGSKDE